jgi:beta-lactamase class A
LLRETARVGLRCIIGITMLRRFSILILLAVSLTPPAWTADIATLRSQIEKVIPRARGQVGVAIKHMESGTELMINADQTYPMASTYKVPILTEVFFQRAAGKLSLSDRIEVTPADVHPGGTIALLLDGPGLQMSIHNLINLMMRVSDNSAADLLLNKVGATNVTARMRSLGLDKIRVDRSTLEMIMDQEGLDYTTYGKLPFPQLRERMDAVDAQTATRANERFNATEKDVATPRQMNALLEKIHRGEIVDRESSDEIIEFMNHSMIGQTRMPAMLPDGTRVVHKTGSISGSTNDVGFIFLPGGGHIAVTVFTKDAKAPTGDREHVIAEIARFAYDYFVFNSK